MLIRSQELCCSKSVCSRLYSACVWEWNGGGSVGDCSRSPSLPVEMWTSCGILGADLLGLITLGLLSICPDFLTFFHWPSLVLRSSPFLHISHSATACPQKTIFNRSRTQLKDSHTNTIRTHTHINKQKQTHERNDVLFKKSDARVIVSQNQLPLTYPSVAVKAC